MDLILFKIFATALALSEVMIQPQAVKTHFDAVADQDKVEIRSGFALKIAGRANNGAQVPFPR